MRQREIERFEKKDFWLCRHSENHLIFLSEYMRHPDNCCRESNGKCIEDNRKCDAVKFQLKEVEDG
jgi:hypothetical protein